VQIFLYSFGLTFQKIIFNKIALLTKNITILRSQLSTQENCNPSPSSIEQKLYIQ